MFKKWILSISSICCCFPNNWDVNLWVFHNSVPNWFLTQKILNANYSPFRNWYSVFNSIQLYFITAPKQNTVWITCFSINKQLLLLSLRQNVVFIHAQAVQELVQHKKSNIKVFLQYSYLKTVKLAILSQFTAVISHASESSTFIYSETNINLKKAVMKIFGHTTLH